MDSTNSSIEFCNDTSFDRYKDNDSSLDRYKEKYIRMDRGLLEEEQEEQGSQSISVRKSGESLWTLENGNGATLTLRHSYSHIKDECLRREAEYDPETDYLNPTCASDLLYAQTRKAEISYNNKEHETLKDYQRKLVAVNNLRKTSSSEGVRNSHEILHHNYSRLNVDHEVLNEKYQHLKEYVAELEEVGMKSVDGYYRNKAEYRQTIRLLDNADYAIEQIYQQKVNLYKQLRAQSADSRLSGRKAVTPLPYTPVTPVTPQHYTSSSQGSASKSKLPVPVPSQKFSDGRLITRTKSSVVVSSQVDARVVSNPPFADASLPRKCESASKIGKLLPKVTSNHKLEDDKLVKAEVKLVEARVKLVDAEQKMKPVKLRPVKSAPIRKPVKAVMPPESPPLKCRSTRSSGSAPNLAKGTVKSIAKSVVKGYINGVVKSSTESAKCVNGKRISQGFVPTWTVHKEIMPVLRGGVTLGLQATKSPPPPPPRAILARLPPIKSGRTSIVAANMDELVVKRKGKKKTLKDRKSESVIKPDKTNKSGKTTKPDKTNKSEKTNKSDKTTKPDKTNRSDKSIKDVIPVVAEKHLRRNFVPHPPVVPKERLPSPPVVPRRRKASPPVVLIGRQPTHPVVSSECQESPPLVLPRGLQQSLPVFSSGCNPSPVVIPEGRQQSPMVFPRGSQLSPPVLPRDFGQSLSTPSEETSCLPAPRTRGNLLSGVKQASVASELFPKLPRVDRASNGMIANTGKFSRFGFQFKSLESYEKIAAAPNNEVLSSEEINISLPQTFLPQRPVAAKRSRTAHTEPGQTTYDTTLGQTTYDTSHGCNTYDTKPNCTKYGEAHYEPPSTRTSLSSASSMINQGSRLYSSCEQTPKKVNPSFTAFDISINGPLDVEQEVSNKVHFNAQELGDELYFNEEAYNNDTFESCSDASSPISVISPRFPAQHDDVHLPRKSCMNLLDERNSGFAAFNVNFDANDIGNSDEPRVETPFVFAVLPDQETSAYKVNVPVKRSVLSNVPDKRSVLSTSPSCEQQYYAMQERLQQPTAFEIGLEDLPLQKKSLHSDMTTFNRLDLPHGDSHAALHMPFDDSTRSVISSIGEEMGIDHSNIAFETIFDDVKQQTSPAHTNISRKDINEDRQRDEPKTSKAGRSNSFTAFEVNFDDKTNQIVNQAAKQVLAPHKPTGEKRTVNYKRPTPFVRRQAAEDTNKFVESDDFIEASNMTPYGSH